MPFATTKPRKVGLRRTLAAIAAVALMGSLVSVGSIGRAYAADSDDDDDTIDTKFVRGILTGLGLKRDGDNAGIDYHERSPLVVPPTRDLPPPANDAKVTSDPAWPKDPDIKQKKKTKKANANQRSGSQAEEDDMRQLSIDQMKATPGAAKPAAAGTVRTSEGSAQPGARPEQLTPSELGHTGWSWKSMFNREGTVIPFVQEPPRASLTDPPPGLRTPSPKYQYGSKGTLEPTREVGTDRAVGSDGVK